MTTFPAAVFGKSLEGLSHEGLSHEANAFRVLARDSAFHDLAEKELRALSRSFQLTSEASSEAIYPDCFAFWPLANGEALLARLCDAGADAFKRPHSLRIEAALIKKSEIPDGPSGCLFLLSTKAWPPFTREVLPTNIALTATAPEPALIEKFNAKWNDQNRVPRVLVSSHQFCRFEAFDLVFDVQRELVPSDARSSPRTAPEELLSRERLPSNLGRTKPASEASGWRCRGLALVLMFVVLMTFVGGWLGYQQLVERDEALAKSRVEGDQVRQDLLREQAKLHRLEKQVAVERQQLKNQLDEKQRELSESKKWAIISQQFEISDPEALRDSLTVLREKKQQTLGVKDRLRTKDLERELAALQRELATLRRDLDAAINWERLQQLRARLNRLSPATDP